MNRLIVTFESESVSKRVCELFAASSLPVRAVCRTGAETIRLIRYMGGGVVVCGVMLPDMTVDQLYQDLEGQACVLAVAKADQLAYCENPRIFRLPLPVNRYDLAASVRMLEQLSEMSLAAERPAPDEQATVRKAKAFLQATRGLTEDEAHRWLQKRSMTLRKRMPEIAAEVLTGSVRD